MTVYGESSRRSIKEKEIVTGAAGERHLPRAYAQFTKAVGAGRSLTELQLRGSRAQVFRFANRYRVAHAFRSVEMAGYAPQTIRAYGALFRIVVTWSVVEQYRKITGLEDIDGLISESDRRRCIQTVARADPGGTFFVAVCERTSNPDLARRVHAVFNSDSGLLTPLMAAVRHAFVHGDLAPGANGAKPGVAQKLASCGCPVVLKAIEHDFDQRVASAESHHDTASIS